MYYNEATSKDAIFYFKMGHTLIQSSFDILNYNRIFDSKIHLIGRKSGWQKNLN